MNARAPQQAVEPAEPYDASNPTHIRNAEKGAKNRARQIREGLGKIVKDPDCRAWLYDMLERTGLGKISMTGNSWTFFNDGMRNVGLGVQAQLLRWHPEAYVDMLRATDSRAIQPPRTGERKDAELSEEDEHA